MAFLIFEVNIDVRPEMELYEGLFWEKNHQKPTRIWFSSLLTLSTQHANSQKSLPPVSYIKAIDVFMSGCTVFVFLSLMEYALVNIVMGDIADIEKKKSMGISSLILGTRGVPIKRKDGAIDQDVSWYFSIFKNPDCEILSRWIRKSFLGHFVVRKYDFEQRETTWLYSGNVISIQGGNFVRQKFHTFMTGCLQLDTKAFDGIYDAKNLCQNVGFFHFKYCNWKSDQFFIRNVEF